MMETAQPQAVYTANQPEVIDTTVQADIEGSASGYTATEKSPVETDVPAEILNAKPFMTVRYNKEDKPLSYDEAVAYAQKGMNYDKVQQRLNETAAKLSEYEASTPEGDDAEKQKQEIIDRQLEDFMNSNPGVDPRRLPEGVIGAWKRGVPLNEAYLSHQNELLGAKLREREKAVERESANRKNETASMGSAGSSGSTRGRQISEESIRNMTAEELDRNHERIWAYLTKK